jgi:Zn-dependent protease with chaperone function
MNYALLLVCVIGAAAAAGYAAASLLVLACARALEDLPARWALRVRALPGASALFLSLGLALPAFLRYEPADTRAWPGPVAVALGLAGLLLAKAALGRGFAAWWATVRLARRWGRTAQPLPLAAAPLPAFVLDDPFPVVAVVGIARPRLFVARQVLDALTPAEIQAVLAHEAGHLAASDNLTRLLLRCLPTLGWAGLGQRLEERWEAGIEIEADRGAGADSALELASALLKVARLAPAGARLGHAVAAFHTGDGVAGRVQALLEAPPAAAADPAVGHGWGRAGLILAALAALAINLLPAVHGLSETLIHLP